MHTDNRCEFCGLRQKALLASRPTPVGSTSRFMSSHRSQALTLRKLQSRMWCHVFSLILVSASVLGGQRFLVEPNSLNVSQGLVVVLNCTIADREGVVQWTQNGVALGANRTLPGYPRYSMIGVETVRASGAVGEWNLKIVDVKLEDDGEYQCQAGATSTARGIRSRSALLTVVIPPEQPTIDGGPTLAVVLHRPTNITCRANNGKPAAEITWYMDSLRVTRNVYSRSHPRPEEKFVDAVGLLTINASKEDSGRQVECRASNAFMQTPYVTTATLDVQYAPEIIMTSNVSNHIREFDYVSFSCVGAANPMEITWRWYRKNQQIEGATTQTLLLPLISYEYNGDTIACTASNRVGQTRQEMTLVVEYGPRIVDVDPVVGADLNQPVELRCQADGNPTPHIIWTRKDRANPARPQPLSTSPTLRLETVDRGSFGVYVCTALSSGFPDASKEVLLMPNGPPTIRSERQQFAEKGEHGKLECTAHSVPKPDRMVWLKEGQPINYATSGRFSSDEVDTYYGRTNVLHILNVQQEDFGSYNCNVANAYGGDNATIALLEKTVPPLPYIIGGVVGGVAVLFVIALACVLFTRYKRGDADSVLGSTTETDSSSADKKRKDADSPSTLMDQWRQDYNKPKDFYRYSADYDELNYKDHTGNNNAYGCLEPSEPQPYSSNTFTAGDYGRALTPLERYEAVYGPAGYSMTSFRGRERAGFDLSNVKLATDV